jgi:hypothetical protein
MGWRKLLVVLLAMAISTIITLNEHQATVLVAAIVAFNAGNAMEHIANNKGVQNALAKVAAVSRRVGSPAPSVSGSAEDEAQPRP